MCEYLGLGAFKAELEDLCFAVLQPATFRQVYDAREAMLAKGTSRSRGRRKVRGSVWHPVSMRVVCTQPLQRFWQEQRARRVPRRRTPGHVAAVRSSCDGPVKDFAVWACREV